MTAPYDFEYRYVAPASCNRCGALVINRDAHDAWHDRGRANGQGICEAVSPETGRACVLAWPHDGMHRVSNGRWFAEVDR